MPKSYCRSNMIETDQFSLEVVLIRCCGVKPWIANIGGIKPIAKELIKDKLIAVLFFIYAMHDITLKKKINNIILPCSSLHSS